MTKKSIFDKIHLFQSPILTSGHRCIGIAALLGVFFVITHIITVVITCVVNGTDWGLTAWILDSLGFVAGCFFAVQCWLSSNRSSENFRKRNKIILIWSIMTVLSRIIDTLMLFGIIKWSSIYITPTGSVLVTNIISEVIFGVLFSVFALIGSTLLLYFPTDRQKN